MKRIILLSILISFLLIHPLNGDIQPKPINQPGKVEAKILDPRAEILKDYLAKYNSPLETHAQDFVDAADKYQIDWKLVPAIAGVESTFGKHIPGGYNGWGWGVYGDQALYFRSWTEGIFTVTAGLRENYFNKGLDNPYEINRVYAASPSWGSHVNFFLVDLDKYAKNYSQDKMLNSNITLDSKNETAGTSAKLSLGI